MSEREQDPQKRNPANEEDDDKCDMCGRAVGFSNLRRHRCRQDSKVHYFCDACLTIHRIENGEPAGYLGGFAMDDQ